VSLGTTPAERRKGISVFFIEIKNKLGHPSTFCKLLKPNVQRMGLKEKKNIGNKMCSRSVHQYGFFIFSEKLHFKTYALNYF
jgi:hypothetical protein